MEELPTITVNQDWEELFAETGRSMLTDQLAGYLKPRRWFGSKARDIQSVSLRDAFRIPVTSSAAFFTLVHVEFAEGPGEDYVVPFAFAGSSRSAPQQNALVARLDGTQTGVLYDALADAEFCVALLDMIGRNERLEGGNGMLRASALSGFAERRSSALLDAHPGNAEQSNTSVTFDERLILKVFRRVQDGINPDLEIGRFLTEQVHFPHTAPVVGAIEYRPHQSAEPATLAILQGFVTNKGDAWKFTLEQVNQFAQRVGGIGRDVPEALPKQHLVDLAAGPPAAVAREWIGSYLDSAALLGQRTAELHLALASSTSFPAFTPEPFSLEHQQLLVRTLMEVVDRNFAQLQAKVNDLPDRVRDGSRRLIEHVETIRQRLQPMQKLPLSGLRCRCHGDYHLGQVLYTGQDFVIIDFEGEPARPLRERRLKQSPLRDVAGMLRSFDYAAHHAEIPGPWHHIWYTWVSAAFLKTYSDTATKGSFLPSSKDEIKLLLDYHLLEKAIYELAYEINHRPDWVPIPLDGIMQLLAVER